MRILLTNDDGVNARGLALLETIARRLADDIWVVAPSEEQSGAGHSLTLTEPVRPVAPESGSLPPTAASAPRTTAISSSTRRGGRSPATSSARRRTS